MSTLASRALAGAFALAIVLVLARPSPAQEVTPGPSSPWRDALIAGAEMQGGRPDPLPNSSELGLGGGIIQALPATRDMPASLFAPPPPPSRGYIRPDEPYLLFEPGIDRDPASPPGWFSGVEFAVVKTKVLPGLSNVVTPGQHISNTPTNGPAGAGQQVVGLPSAPLNWTVSPRFFVGYRFPSGFGGFMASYRYLGTSGSGTLGGPAGPFTLRSGATFNFFDLDYVSNEWSLRPRWEMKWTIGLRNLFLYYGSHAYQPASQAAAGNGILNQRDFNNLYGIGPHVSLGLTRHIAETRWSFTAWGDLGAVFDYTNQLYAIKAQSTTGNGGPAYGSTSTFGHQATPMVNGRVGLTWQPAQDSQTRLFVGYQYEYLWDLTRLSQGNGSPVIPGSLGQLFDQGLVFQLSFRF